MTKKPAVMPRKKTKKPQRVPAKLEAAVEFTAEGGGLIEKIQQFTIRFLKREYPNVDLQTSLSVFKDGRTLDVLAGAFADEVQCGTLFSGLIDPAKLKLPQDEYYPIIEKKGATVSSVVQYFLKKAKKAAP